MHGLRNSGTLITLASRLVSTGLGNARSFGLKAKKWRLFSATPAGDSRSSKVAAAADRPERCLASDQRWLPLQVMALLISSRAKERERAGIVR